MGRPAIPAVFTLLLLAGVVCAGQAPAPRPVFIRLELPEASPRYRNQWAYLFCMAGNDLILVDSCFLDTDTRSADFTMTTGHLPPGNRAFYEKHRSEYRFWITFAARGPVELYFYAMPGDSVRVEAPLTRYERIQAHAPGSAINEMLLRSLGEQELAARNLARLLSIDSLRRTARQQDSLVYYGKRLSHAIFIDNLRETPSYDDALTLLGILKSRAPEQLTDSLIGSVRRRFPQSEAIRRYPAKLKTPPPAPSTKKTRERYARILADWRTKQSDGLYIGSAFPDAELPDTAGVRRSIARFSNKRFVLVDFWASWCIPCRSEAARLKRAAQRFGDELAVCAVSLDADSAAWRDAIRRDSSHSLTHLRLGLKNRTADWLMNYLPIDRIPANFLLGPDRRIVAMNLRGTSFEMQLEEILAAY